MGSKLKIPLYDWSDSKYQPIREQDFNFELIGSLMCDQCIRAIFEKQGSLISYLECGDEKEEIFVIASML